MNLIYIGLINIGFFLVFVKYNILEVRNATFFSEDKPEKLKSGKSPQRERSIQEVQVERLFKNLQQLVFKGFLCFYF